MRGTSKITNSNSLLYMSRNFQNLNKVTGQLANQRQVMNLKDDPMSANIGIQMATLVARAEQYNRNIKQGIHQLDLSDSRLQTAKAEIDKVKTIITGAANEPSTSAETRSANATQLNEIFKTLVNLGNTSDGSRYIFGGSKTTSSPFEIVNGRYVNYTGNQDKINIVVDANTTMPINVTGSDIYGNMTTKIPSKDMNPDINMSTDHSTRLSDLNGGSGVPKGKIVIKYDAYPQGLEVDLSNCDTLEDVKDAIEQQTLAASQRLNPKEHTWLDDDWEDLKGQYVQVTMNNDKNGICLTEYNKDGDVVSGFLSVEDYASNKVAEGLGIRGTSKNGSIVGRDLDPVLSERTLLADLDGYNDSTYTFTNGPKTGTTEINEVSQDANNIFNSWNLKGLSIGTNTGEHGELYAKAVLLEGETTLSSDLAFPGPYDLYGPATIAPGQVFDFDTEVTISGTKYPAGRTTFPEGAILLEGEALRFEDGVTLKKGTVLAKNPNPTVVVQIYTKPVDKATAADLVATGTYSNSGRGGTVVIEEANQSGISGTVGIVFPDGTNEAKVNLEVNYPDSLQGSVHVPAFIEEKNADGTSKDTLNIASGWNIKGLDKPPAEGYNQNHPASTDLEGNVSVNYRYDENSGNFFVELSRPAYGNQPAQLLATGTLYVGTDTPLQQSVSGRIEFVGEPGFEGVSGSVFIELPSGAYFTGKDEKTENPTVNTFQLTESIQPPSTVPPIAVTLGGATELAGDAKLYENTFILKGDTLFKEGQTFSERIRLPSGGYLEAGQPLQEDTLLSKGMQVTIQGYYQKDEVTGEVTLVADTLKKGTVLASGQALDFESIPAGTVIPRGSSCDSISGPGFPAGGMGIGVESVDGKSIPAKTVVGYDVQATFATIEDLNRKIAELGIHVSAEVSADGKGLEFTSRLAGAWLTVSEDTDCYEQTGDVNNQLSGLDLNGLVKGENTDGYGNVYTEVIFYPPEYDKDTGKPLDVVRLVSDDGTITEIKPGYYVRVYSDKNALNHSYENRDSSSMVAEGFLELSDITGDPNGPNPFAADAGFKEGLVLKEMNGSGVSGRVDLNYYGSGQKQSEEIWGEDPETKVPVFQGYNYNLYENTNITVFPGGLRPASSDYVTIQQADIYDVTPGVHADYKGQIHGTFTKTDTDKFTITFYKDSSHTNITGRSLPQGEISTDDPDAIGSGTVIIYSVNKDGKFLDINGNVIQDESEDNIRRHGVPIGTVNIPDKSREEFFKADEDTIPTGTVDSFTLKTGANRNYGQEREENIFSTINDAIDALNRNDTETLHNLLEDAQRDIDRILGAISDVGSRNERMDLLSERHSDDVVKFTDLFTKRVGMDETALASAVISYQAATNSYQAAMQVSASIMQMSLLQYL